MVLWSRGGSSGGWAVRRTFEVRPLESLCSVICVRSNCEEPGEGPLLGVGARESIGGGSYAIVVSENFS